MKTHKFIMGCMILLSLFTACSTKQDTEIKKTIKSVKLDEVKTQTSNNKMILNASIKEKSLVNLSFRVGGPLVNVNVQVGDYVRKGDVIAQIDKRDYEIQLQTTKAQFEQIEGEYKRYKDLYEADKLPANNFEKIKSGYLMTKAAYENAQNQLNDTKLTAPFSGYIFAKLSENYQTVGPGQTIVSIIDVSSLEIIAYVSESQLMHVKENHNSQLDVKNAGLINHPITMKSIGDKALPSGLFELKYELKNSKEYNVSPGMSAQIMISNPVTTNALIIPSTAVFVNGNSSFVWLYNTESKRVKKRQIVLGSTTNNGNIEVTKGLQVGDQIISAGVHALIDGQTVSPMRKTSATNIGGLL